MRRAVNLSSSMVVHVLSAPLLLLLASCVPLSCHGFSSQRQHVRPPVRCGASPSARASMILTSLIQPATRGSATTFLAASSDSSDAQYMDEEQQSGIDEAFVSLDALTPEDWDGNSSVSSDDTSLSDLKHSRTDDTLASNVAFRFWETSLPTIVAAMPPLPLDTVWEVWEQL